MGNTSDWKLKVKVDCPDCNGTGISYKDYYTPDTIACYNSKCQDGKVIVEVEPLEIPKFMSRPESLEYSCACGKTEIILRPQLNQLPIGWINWSGELLCTKCKTVVVYAALIAAANKVQQIKESISE